MAQLSKVDLALIGKPCVARHHKPCLTDVLLIGCVKMIAWRALGRS